MANIDTISQQQIKKAIDDFLLGLYHKKADKDLKQLAKAQENNDLAKINELLAVLQSLQLKFCKSEWLAQEAQKMARQLKFGTHISKGVHPDAKGDNVRYTPNPSLPIAYVGTHTLPNLHLDANGNAAALPLAAFFDCWIDDEQSIKMRDLILGKHPALTGCFDDDLTVSDSYQQLFFACLNNQPTNPKTHERNKQLLWAIDKTDLYHTIVPLYPSVLTHDVYHKIQELRYSAANQSAKESRHKKSDKQMAYVSIPDLTILHLGGTKPQNVSQLISKKSGRVYLLPSVPPSFKASSSLSIHQSASNFFDIKGIRFYTHELLSALFKNIASQTNNVQVRSRRDDIIEEILLKIIQLASDIQHNQPAGWSKDCHLPKAQQYWLDPQRAELDTAFDTEREHSDWHAQIAQDFANWLQKQLKHNFKKNAHHFGAAEHQAWAKHMKQTIAHSQYLGEKVFV